MREEQVLPMSGKELSKFAGTILQPEKKHAFNMCGRCINCYKERKVAGSVCESPIQLHWSTAMSWREIIVQRHDDTLFKLCMLAIYESRERKYSYVSFMDWLSCYAQPEDYIKASVLCEMRTK